MINMKFSTYIILFIIIFGIFSNDSAFCVNEVDILFDNFGYKNTPFDLKVKKIEELEARKRYKEAIKEYKKLLKAKILIKDQIFQILYKIGLCYGKLLKYNKTFYYWKKALLLKPKNKELLYKIGVVAIKLRKEKSALFSFRQIVKLYPDDLTARDKLTLIEKMRMAGYFLPLKQRARYKKIMEAKRIKEQLHRDRIKDEYEDVTQADVDWEGASVYNEEKKPVIKEPVDKYYDQNIENKPIKNQTTAEWDEAPINTIENRQLNTINPDTIGERYYDEQKTTSKKPKKQKKGKTKDKNKYFYLDKEEVEEIEAQKELEKRIKWLRTAKLSGEFYHNTSFGISESNSYLRRENRLRLNITNKEAGDANFFGQIDFINSNYIADESFEIKNLYVILKKENLEFVIGRKQYKWGLSQYFQVMDVINPQDLREHILRTVENEDTPTNSLALKYFGKNTKNFLEVLWIPNFEKTKYRTDGVWNIYKKVIPVTLNYMNSGVLKTEYNKLNEILPTNSLKNSEYGFRYFTEGKKSIFSFGIFQGWNNMPAFHMTSTIANNILSLNVTPQYYKSNITAGYLKFKGSIFNFFIEAGLTDKELFHIYDPQYTGYLVEKATTSYSFGIEINKEKLERQKTEIKFQYYTKQISEYTTNIYEPSAESFFSLNVKRVSKNAKRTDEFLYISDSQSNGGMLYFSTKDTITPLFSSKISFVNFEGSENTFFGSYNSNDMLRLEFLYKF